MQFSCSRRPGRSITVEVYYRPLSTLQTALWGNGNFVLCDVFLFYKSGHKPFKGSANEGFYKSVNSLKFTAPFLNVPADKPHLRF